MKTLLPIDIEGDSSRIHDAICRMLARSAVNRKDITIGLEAVKLMVVMDKYYNDVWKLEKVVATIDEMFR